MKKWIFKYKLVVVFGVLLLNILLIFGINFIENLLELNEAEYLFGKDEVLEDLGFYIIFVCIIAPVFEETIFRLPLKKKSFNYFKPFS